MPSASRATVTSSASSPRRPRNLSDVDRRMIYERLLEISVDGKLPRGSFVKAALHVSCHARTISRLWDQARASIAAGSAVADTSAKMKGETFTILYNLHFGDILLNGVLVLGNCGPKVKRRPSEIEAAIKAVAHHDRQTLRSTAFHSKIPKTIIIRHMAKENTLKGRSNRVKPLLTEDNKKARLKFVFNFLRSGLCGSHYFENMYNYVHVDKKWFLITQVNGKFYVCEDETVALRAVKSKRFITKVMFLAAVARPRHDAHRNRHFDGKIGIWRLSNTPSLFERAKTALKERLLRRHSR
ncbi:Aste57867_9868 [Aphanomyces stellatus]|uniref:Aste57867_9868 protein n=1 Tax=Aphanomyces stellatus TaxID=120398 RepID=A0A485KP80_9STRA|nr:hypothetical protein As57867_009829 [Aphanomyces stellatus]VFT86747.1 Aste57867_9868 [Aphanomyces stellatus]